MKRIPALPCLLILVLAFEPLAVRGQYMTWRYDKLIEANSGQNAYSPRVAISGLKAVAAWTQFLSGARRVYVNNSIDGGKTWKTPRLIEDNNQSAYDVDIAMSGNLVVAAWRQLAAGATEDHYQVFVNTSADGGQTWGSDRAIEDNAGFHAETGPSISISGTRVVIVWPQSDFNKIRIYSNYSTDSGATWHLRRVLDRTTAYHSSGPKVALWGLNAVAVFLRSDGANTRVYRTNSTDGGVTWTPDALLEFNSGYTSFSPLDVVMSGTHAIAVWFGYAAGGIGECVWANHSGDGGSNWDGAKLLKQPILSTAAYPKVAVSGSKAVAAWMQMETDLTWTIRANRSTDCGTTWGTAQPIGSATVNPIQIPFLAMSGTNVVATWSESDGTDFHIFSNFSSDGGLFWRTARRIENLSGTNALYEPSVALSGTKAVAVWEEYDGANWRIASNYGIASAVQKSYLLPPKLNSPANGASGLSTSVNMTWLDMNSSPQELKYKLRIKVAGGAYAAYALGNNAVNYLKTGLRRGKTYYWNVMAMGNGTTILNSPWANGGKDFKFTIQP